MEKYNAVDIYRDISPRMFVNMYKTVVLFEENRKHTVQFKEENTISMESTGSDSGRMTAKVAVASDKIKAPFFRFQRTDGGRIEL